jgi:CubicO group peptidase (beta-lactamase class C family)
MTAKILGGLIAMFLWALGAGAQSLTPLPPQPAGLAWPTSGWETGDLPPESKADVETLIAEAMGKGVGDVMGQTRGLVIIWRGRLVAEAYAEHFTPDTKQISWSMAKSVTQAMVGRTVQLGLIKDIDAPMPSPFKAGDKRREITWRQWMNAVDGQDYHELDGDPDLTKNDVVQLMYGDGRFDVVTYVEKAFPLAHEPGTYWNYSTPAFHLIGWALQSLQPIYDSERTALRGRVQLTPELASEVAICERLRPLGDSIPEGCRTLNERVEVYRQRWVGDGFLTNLSEGIGMKVTIESDAAGTYLGGSLVWASSRDFAKFGYLYLRDGVWEGERLLPEGWVDFARSPGPAANTNVYGAGWWIIPPQGPLTHHQNADSDPRDAFHAGGHEGQTIWVVPSRDLVIVRLGLMPNEGDNWPALYEWNQRIARAFPVVE